MALLVANTRMDDTNLFPDIFHVTDMFTLHKYIITLKKINKLTNWRIIHDSCAKLNWKLQVHERKSSWMRIQIKNYLNKKYKGTNLKASKNLPTVDRASVWIYYNITINRRRIIRSSVCCPTYTKLYKHVLYVEIKGVQILYFNLEIVESIFILFVSYFSLFMSLLFVFVCWISLGAHWFFQFD